MLKQILSAIKGHMSDVLVVVAFAAVAFAYFYPADIEGRILYRHDSSAGRGAGQEVAEYKAQSGEQSRWTNSLFSGMPTYQSAPSYDSVRPLSALSEAYHLWLPENVWFLFAYLLGFYILLRAFDFRWHLAALGSVVWAFSSYFLIIIAAGHLWKVMALAYLPPMIGGIALVWRRRYGLGFVVTTLFAALEILANHVQMTYYYMFIIAFMVVAWTIEAARRKQYAHCAKAIATCLAAAALAVMMNASNLYHTWQYQKESMRGKSELVKKNSANQTSSGLDRDYITQWSYGLGETWTLLVPNTKGGSSMSPITDSEVAMRHANNDYISVYQQLGQYWGEQPGTSGPVYIGAIVCMLFLLGLLIVPGPMKWALLAATVLSVLLSWGRNFMPMTDFFIDHVPMYAKFRTVASILVIAEFTMPLLALMAVKRLVETPDALKRFRRPLLVATGVTGGVCLLFATLPTLFFSDFVSQAEMQALSQFPADQLAPLLSNLREVRQAMFAADCWRSLWIVVIGAATVAAFLMGKIRAVTMSMLLAAVCLVDLWQVDKRYLNDAMFVNADVRELPQPMTETDRLILQDRTPDYRVLNFASNTFNENETSYYHKSIGGYHAAKLRRYQELVERYIQPEMQTLMKAVAEVQGDMTAVGDSVAPVINMLNTRYLIMPLQGGATMPLLNPHAMGNAWFVDRTIAAANANAELDNMSRADLRREAVVAADFQEAVGKAVPQDSAAAVTLTAYKPNHLEYKAVSRQGGVIVFSEIYYPGWTATVDGREVPVGRADYVLRAINVSAGEHRVALDFHPATLRATEATAYSAYAIVGCVLLLIVVARARRKGAKA